MSAPYVARGLQGVILTRDDRAGEGKLSSRLGLVTEAVEAPEGMDLYAYLVAQLSKGGKADYVIVDEAQPVSFLQERDAGGVA